MKKETFLPWLMVLLIAGWVVLSGCGTGGFNGETSISVTHSVSLGPISKGEVTITRLDGTLIGSGITSGFDPENDTTRSNGSIILKNNEERQVGKFQIDRLNRAGLSEDDLVTVKVSGGQDIDPNDDGFIFSDEGENGPRLMGELYAIVKLSDLMNGKVVVNALTTMSYAGVQGSTDPDEIKSRLDRFACYLFKEPSNGSGCGDINGDGAVDMYDIYHFDPTAHSFADTGSQRDHDQHLRGTHLLERLLPDGETENETFVEALLSGKGADYITAYMTGEKGFGDADNDGLPNIFENPDKNDTDGDGLSDGNPLEIDMDGDGILDEDELRYGLNPWIDDSTEDTDSDGIINGDETANGLNPIDNRDGAAADTDKDSLNNLSEIKNRTDPKNSAPQPENGVVNLIMDQNSTCLSTISVTDPEGDTIYYKIVGSPNHGTASINSTGDFNYRPVVDFKGNDTFLIELSDDANGGTVAARVNVAVNEVNEIEPSVNISADPGLIERGGRTTLTWSSSHAESCVIQPEIGGVDTNGSINVSPFETTTYTIKATGPGGAATAGVTIEVANSTRLPDVNLTASPEIIQFGETSILNWRSSNADFCAIEPDIGVVDVNGSIRVAPNRTTTYMILAVGPGGIDFASVTVRVDESSRAPTVSLSADPETIQIRESSTLTWRSTNADSCVIEPGIGAVDVNGAIQVSPTQTNTYTITATGAGGSATANVTVTVLYPPTVEITANPETILLGESSTLTWNSANADSCVIEPDIGSIDVNGAIQVSPTQTTTYTITATGPGGTASDSVTVTYLPPTVSMSVSADTINLGESCTLSWNSTNADTCVIEPGIGSVETEGSVTILPIDTTTYTITATGPGGTATASVTVTVIHPPPTVSMRVSADTINFGESCTLSWDSTHTAARAIEPEIGSVDASGSRTISPEDSITYTITATGTGGTATASVAVTVIPPVPSVSLSADPGTVYSGRSAALSWQAIHADTCVIEPGIGSVDAEGSVRVWPTETTTYTITATGPGGFATATTTVAITSTQSDPPVIEINDPLDMAVVDTDTVAISGTVTPADAEVWVNGIPAHVVNGNFTSANIPLKPGANAIIATASHSRVTGNDKIWVVRAYEYQPQPEGSFGKRYEDLVPPDAVVASYEAKRFAVVTGQVLLTDGSPLADVSITIYGHPEYGTAYSDQEGRFSIPLEGGKTFAISFVRSGLLTVHRQVYVPVNDTAVCETVRMTAQDTRSTVVTFDGNAETHITHQSTEISDEFGSRSCRLVFSGDNRAYAMDEKGQVMEELASIMTRATTYTTPESMPARLPPNSAYTYCVELSVDGAERIEFEKPVVVWVDNYLDFDVGEIVPAGYYDKNRGVWVPSDNGVVVRLLDTDSDGIVDALDANGDGQPDDMDEDGSFSSEVEGLEERVRYAPDSTFWRVEVTHFTAWDFNWPWNQPVDATYPNRNSTSFADLQPVKSKPCIRRNSSFVEERSRVFHEDIPIPGTDVFLHYTSSRVTGYKTVITIPASGDTVPPSLKRIVVKIELAGRTFEQYLPALPYQMAEFVWDGLDHLGRAVNGPAMAHVGVGFAYDAYYTSAGANGSQAFGQPGGASTGIGAQREVVLWNREDVYLPKGQGVIAEGWTLSPHHQMSLIDLSTLYKGDGAILSNNAHIESELNGYSGASPTDVEVDAAGNVYIAELENVWKLDPNGNSTPVVPVATGDPDIDSPSPTARFDKPGGVAIDTEGNLYISDSYNHRIRKVDTSGIVTTIAGCGPTGFFNGGFSGDGGPAIQARLDNPAGIAVDTWGNIYFSDYYNYRIRKVDVNGIITTVAGGGEQRVDGVPATESRIGFPIGIDVDAAGNIYFIENCGLRKVDASGIISTVIPIGESPYANGVAVDTAGNLYVSELRYLGRIRKINTSGIVTNFPNAGSTFDKASGLAVDSQGNLYVAIWYRHKVYKIAPPFVFFGAMSPGDIAFAEESGIGHILSSSGLHERTIDLNTGVVLREFDYDADNRLTAVTDQLGNQIIIGRDANGMSATIASPEGLITALTVDADNRLTRITYPDDSYYSFEYSSEGLLAVKTEPEGNRFTHQFDALGRLTDATDDEGGQWSYSRSTEGSGDIITQVLTAEGDLTTYLDHTDSAGIYTSTITDPTGAETLFTQSVDGLTVNKSLPCGMELEFEYGIDSEYKFKYVKTMTETTPSGLTRITENTKTYQDTDLDLTPDRITETVAVNGKTSTIVNNTNESRKTITSPEGRTAIIDYDPDTLLTASVESGGLYGTFYEYDNKGRLTSAITHTRTSTLTYNEQGFLETLTDAKGHTTTYSYDGVGRMTTIDRPDGSIVGFDYDLNGNMTVLTNPAAIAHSFDFNGVNLNSSYETPLSGTYSYAYDKDRRLIRTTFPSGRQIQNVYDTSRLVQIQTPEGDIGFTYLCGAKVESVVKGAETITYEYDGSLVTSEVLSGTINQTLEYSYDEDFNVIGFTYAGDTVYYAYDDDGLLIGAGDFTISRNAENGLPESVTDGPLNSTRSFNGYGELDGKDVAVSGNSITSWNLTRDNSGRITAKTEVVAAITSAYDYTYDSLGRLLTVLKDGMLVEEYQYNANGTRTYEMNALRGITGRSYAYSDEDHLLTAGAATFQYDLDGFLTTKTVGTETASYTYSSRGELLDVTLPDGTFIEYVHDSLGRRIAKKTNGTITEKYLWQGLTRLIAVYDGGDNIVIRFEYADGRMPVAMTSGGSTYYLTYDQVGSLRVVADGSGNVVKSIEYDSFGNIISESNPSFEVPFGFAGGLHDRDTGLVRFGYRDYDPDIGRWTAKDPIFFEGGDTDLYGYCLNDSVNRFDPFGLKTTIIIQRNTSTGASISSRITVSSDSVSDTFSGFAVEPKKGGEHGTKDPVTANVYKAFVRTDHNPNRIELRNVPNYENIQIHIGNDPLKDSDGCFLVGTDRAADWVSNSNKAMDKILKIINRDASGEIEVHIRNTYTRPCP